METEHVGCCRMGIFIFAAFAIVIGCGIFVLGIIDVNGVHYPTIIMGIYVIVTHVILFLAEYIGITHEKKEV